MSQSRAPSLAKAKPVRRPRQRLSTEDRRKQIVEGAIAFFSERGLDGQTRDLAKQIGITHPLLYHYFPSKRDLIEHVYQEVYLGRWREEWEHLLDDQSIPFPERLTRFYTEYARGILSKEWVRILVLSGLSDGYIPDKYMQLLKERLMPRIVRETRRHIGADTEAATTELQQELIWGLHGGIFYIGIRHWIYGLPLPHDIPAVVTDRVRSYLLAAEETFGGNRPPR
jgi:AcrR family transcriptional regulator